jgi:hypothetical protein
LTGRSFLSAPTVSPTALKQFPAVVLPVGTALHRIHAITRGAWYFDDEPMARFNPVGRRGFGACYFAERPVAGLLERYKGITMVDEADVAANAHFSVNLEVRLRLADLCSSGARRFGLTGEIHTTPDYAITQAWATALARAGFKGIKYLCRSDPGMRLVGFALFDVAGAPPPRRWPAGDDRPISDTIIREAEDYGLYVRPTP